jgi:predicted alpha/beta hydrolase family esterase
MNKVYIVHCWDGTKDDGWYPWLDKELTNENTTVYRFNMPNTKNPKIEEWVPFLDSMVKDLDNNTYFVGHSIGCQTILRFLQSRDITNIGGILLVAPWLDLLPEAINEPESYETAKPWLTTPIDFEKVKKFTSNINCIFSDDDYFVSLSQKEVFERVLNAKTIVVSNKGHISQEDDVYELKEILDVCNSMIK